MKPQNNPTTILNSEPRPFALKDRVDGRILKRKSVGDDKALNITAAGAASNSITQAMMTDGSVGKAELRYEEITVNVTAGQTSGTGACTSGSVIIGWRPAGNVDQFVDNIALSGTTITVTLAAAATDTNNFVVICLKA